jgi:hypothetical protein
MTNRRSTQTTDRLANLSTRSPRQEALLHQLRADRAAADRTDVLDQVQRAEAN